MPTPSPRLRAPPHLHALPPCHRRDNALPSPLRQATQTLPPSFRPLPCTHAHAQSPPPSLRPLLCPACMPFPFARMPRAQEDGGDAHKGEGRMQGERAHGMRDGATRTVTVVSPHARKGHASEAGCNPGRGAMHEWKGAEGWAHQSGGAKGSQGQATVCPCTHAKGQGV